MKRIDDMISLVDDLIPVAEEQDRLADSRSLKRLSGESFVVFHLKALREQLVGLNTDLTSEPLTPINEFLYDGSSLRFPIGGRPLEFAKELPAEFMHYITD